MGDFQDLYYKDVVEIPLYNWRDVWLVERQAPELPANPTQFGVTWNIGDWWVQ